MEKENWKPIEGFEGIYEVSDMGRVRSLDRYIERAGAGKVGGGGTMFRKGKVLKTTKQREGYELVMLCHHCKEYVFPVHRLVAKAFCENPHNYKTVDHINRIRSDNRAENLEWVTQSENNKRAYERGASRSRLHAWIVAEEADGRKAWFPSQQKAADYYGVSQTTVANSLRGGWKTKNGVKFERMKARRFETDESSRV